MTKLPVECTDWRARERNTLRGFADIYLPSLHLEIRDCDRGVAADTNSPQI